MRIPTASLDQHPAHPRRVVTVDSYLQAGLHD